MKNKPTTYQHLLKMMRKITNVHGRSHLIHGDVFEIAKLKDSTQGILVCPKYVIKVQYSENNKQFYKLKEAKNNETILKVTRYLKEGENNSVHPIVERDDSLDILERLWDQHMEGHRLEK